MSPSPCRLCLTYNVTLASPRGKPGIAAPAYGPNAAAIGALFGDWSKHVEAGGAELRLESDEGRDRDPQSPSSVGQKLAVILEHRYTQDGLNIDALKGVDRAGLLGSLVAAMLAIDAEEALGRLIDHIGSSGKYDLTATQLAAVFGLEKQFAKLAKPSPAVATWLSVCRSALERRTRSAPPRPTDFRRAAELSCHCNDCRALASFLADPGQSQARFPMAKNRRQHLHQIIEGHRCDCTHVTDRRGNPHTLVCTKTTASYEAACKIHERDVSDLARVVAIETKVRSSGQ